MHFLVATSEPTFAAALARRLRRDGALVDIASGPSMALGLCVSTTYDLVVVDDGLPDTASMCRELHEVQPSQMRILLLCEAGAASDAHARHSQIPPDDQLTKPVSLDELVERVHELGSAHR